MRNVVVILFWSIAITFISSLPFSTAQSQTVSSTQTTPQLAADKVPLPIVQKWHPFEVTVTGDRILNEKSGPSFDGNPNPFVDYELVFQFTHVQSGEQISIPGYFDGDGLFGSTGDVWRAIFAPDRLGHWQYHIETFTLNGADLGISKSGSFYVRTSTATSGTPGVESFFKLGRLEYVGKHYLKFRDGGYFLKGGPDSPENFLGYSEFDDTTHHGAGILHSYPAHGGIFGALDYLAEQGMNTIYFLPMNIGGDAKDTWPYADPFPAIDPFGDPMNDNLHFDLSKLRQWREVLEHAQKKGIFLHFVLTEAETPNKQELDDATFGLERATYYRELVARFGYLPALQWNISEEYDLNLDLGNGGEHLAMVDGMAAIDPYDHPIAIHNWQDAHPLWLADGNYQNPNLNVMSIQDGGGDMSTGDDIEEIYNYTHLFSFQRIVMGFDEPRSTSTSNFSQQRRTVVWPSYLSGAAGVEIYVSSQDQSLEDFGQFETIWGYIRHAMSFMHDNLPFWQMRPDDSLVNIGNAQVLAKENEAYGIYLPNGGIPTLQAEGSFRWQWFNPIDGAYSDEFSGDSSGGLINLTGNPFGEAAVWVKGNVCSNGQTRSCAAPGVCALTPDEFCEDNIWSGCEHPPEFQDFEVKCSDGLDNDCDGLTDSNDPDCGSERIWLPPGSFTYFGAMTLDSSYTSSSSLPPDEDVDEDALNALMAFASSSTSNPNCLPDGDYLSASFDVAGAANYYAWGRFYYPGTPGSNEANSFCIQIDEGPIVPFGNNLDYFQEFHWDGNGNIDQGPLTALNLGMLASGTHTVTIYKREVQPLEEPRLDFLLITDDASYTPSDNDVEWP